MTDKARELLERALEQADYIYFVTCEADTLAEEIRAYLAEPEVKRDDEPVATLDHNGNFKLLRMVGVTFEQPINLYEHPAPKQDDEPVAWLIPGGITERKDLAEANGNSAKPLYLHPAPRKSFVRLSEEECISIHRKWVDSGRSISRFARAIEDALERNNR